MSECLSCFRYRLKDFRFCPICERKIRRMFRRSIGEERRGYIRLDSIFPVEFKFIDKESKTLSAWIQSFTNNISKGGICLTVNNLSKENEEILRNKLKYL